MAALVPYPFEALVTRMHRELEQRSAIFDLPARKFYLGEADLDFGVRFHGLRASSPLGPAAGPHTQMAQNIVLCWLGGCRIMELKTVQINDELTIPRPCIDMQTIGFNAEWSQELKLQQSLEEYVKGAMLVEMLRSGDGIDLANGFDQVRYDMSVGYDLAGIRSEGVRGFIEGMLDAESVVESLKRLIPDNLSHLRGLDYPTRLCDSVTLSTFHGCPPDEIESIVVFLMREYRLHCVVKFNPTLLGARETRRLLHEVLGYTELTVPDSAFERDSKWDDAVGMMERLGQTARSLGLGLGAKFSNTLVVQNERGFLPESESEVYLSGQPLHVLAMNLVKRFRDHFGDRFPISFAAGVDRGNFVDAAALGLVPITVCSDLLKPQGYGRLQRYNRDLAKRMRAVGAADLDEFVIRAYGLGEAALDRVGLAGGDARRAACLGTLARGVGSLPGELRAAAGDELFARWVSEAKLLNTDCYVALATADERYARANNTVTPKKIGRHLELFDCVSCDKCIPVCPNDANFVFTPVRREVPLVELRRSGSTWEWVEQGTTSLAEKHQIANFADFCNECGNCDVFCPEDGGPQLVKPRFFGSEEQWRRFDKHEGFYLERTAAGDRMLGRFEGGEFELRVRDEVVTYSGEGFTVRFERSDPSGTVTVSEGDSEGPAAPEQIDLASCHIMDCIREGILSSGAINYVNMLAEAANHGRAEVEKT